MARQSLNQGLFPKPPILQRVFGLSETAEQPQPPASFTGAWGHFSAWRADGRNQGTLPDPHASLRNPAKGTNLMARPGLLSVGS